MTPILKFLSSELALTRALPTPARAAVLIFLLASLADGVLLPFFAIWAQRQAGVPIGYIGLLLGCYAGGELLATPLVGGIADRRGRRPVLLVSTTGIGLGFLLLCFAHGVLAVAASLLLIGAFESVLHPTAATVIADLAPPDQFRRHYALTRVASSAGRVIGPAAGAVLVQHSLGLVFAGSAAAMLLAAVLVTTLLHETRVTGSEPAGEDDDEDFAALLTVFRDRRLATLLLPVAIVGIASSWIESVMPLYATDAGTLTPSGIGLLFTGAAMLGVVFQLPMIRLTARMTGFSIVLVSGGILTLAFGSLLLSASLPSLVLAVILVSFAGMMAGPLVQGIVAEAAPAHARATYMAAFSTVNDVQDAAGPAMGTVLYAVAATLPWLVGVPVALTASLLLAHATRRHEAAAE